MIEISQADALRYLTDAVKEKGEDFIYSDPDGLSAYEAVVSCYYVHQDDEGNNVPGCGVGNALFRAGVPLEILHRHEHSGSQSLLKALKEDGVVSATPEAAAMFALFQAAQDQGRTWGEALERATADEEVTKTVKFFN